MPARWDSSVKINAVAMKGVTEHDVVPLARFGRERGIEIRYIEFMPLDAQGIWDRSRVLIADEMIAMLSREIGAAGSSARSGSARACHGVPFRSTASARSGSSPRSASRSA